MSKKDSSILKTTIAGMDLSNCVLLAAGTAGTLEETAGAIDLSRVGGLVTKSITLDPRDGNPPWRVAPVRAGMLNAIGLANPGIERFIGEYAPRVGGVPTAVIGSIAGFSVDDYVEVASKFDELDAIPAVELNVSCPNVHGGVEFGVDPVAISGLVAEVRAVLTRTRLFVKLSPIAVGQPGMVAIARAAIEPQSAQPAGPNARPGADGLTLCNTTPAMGIDVKTRAPLLGNTTGGLSGPAVHPVVCKIIHDVYRGIARDSQTPIIGVGGVLGWRDAAAFVLAGASAVQVGAGLFVDTQTPKRLVRGLGRWVSSQGAASISDLVGQVGAA